MFTRSALAIAMLCTLAASDAAAQAGFVQGGVASDIKRFSNDGGQSAFDGTTSGVWFGGAGFLAPQFSVGVELDFGGETTTSETVSVPITGRPTEITTTFASRRRSVSALAGFHATAGSAVRIGCYLGLSFTAFHRAIASDAPPVVLEEPEPLAEFEERITGAIVGVDVAIRVAPHLAIVPALRAQGLSLSGDLTGFSIRPSIGARVTF
jgi:hypothetical protein